MITAMFRRYPCRRYPVLYSGIVIIGLISLTALLAPWISPFDPLEQNLDNLFQPPSLQHIFGTDSYGRDVFSRMVHGARISLWIGFFAVSISLSIGVCLGLIAGYFRGITDTVIMRFVDIMLCFPSFFLILAVIAFLGQSLLHIMIVIGFTSWMGITRLVRAEALSLREREFVLAAKLAGASHFRIILRHIFPNTLPPILVAATLGIASAILIESALSFLGIGIDRAIPSWGNILLEGKRFLQNAWWLSFFPGMAILLTVLGYYLLGEGIRDILDPRYNQD